VVDGERVIAFFESGDLVALDHQGKLLWQRGLGADYGTPAGNHGLGTSPVPVDDLVVLTIDHDGPSYLLAVEAATGKTRWRTERSQAVAWSSPAIYRGAHGTQIVTSASGTVAGYSATDGARVWWLEGIKGNTVASPTIAGETIYVGSSEKGQSLAIRAGGKGDISATHIIWRAGEATCSFASPLADGTTLFLVSKPGIIFAVEGITGAPRGSIRLPDSTWATPLAAQGRQWYFCKGGAVVVMEHRGETFQTVAEAKLPIEGRVYGVAAVDGRILVRVDSEVICLAGE
jgi:outer membrane protein assembly factor BamB